MSFPTLRLSIVSQERRLLETEAAQVTLPGSDGEMTVLPKHVALFTQLKPGELRYRTEPNAPDNVLVVSPGFADISPDNTVTVMVDSAVAEREISVEKAQQAIRHAQATMEQTRDQRELLMAEASLKRAMLELNLAEKSQRRRY